MLAVESQLVETEMKVGLFLYNCSGEVAILSYEFSLTDETGNCIHVSPKSTRKFAKDEDNAWGWSEFFNEFVDEADFSSPSSVNVVVRIELFADLGASFSIYGIGEPPGSPTQFEFGPWSPTSSLPSSPREAENVEVVHNFTVVCEGEMFPCNKLALTAKSPVLDRMVQQANLYDIARIELTNVSRKTLTQLLHYLHTSKFASRDTHDVFDLLKVAQIYRIDDLCSAAENVLKVSLNVETAGTILILSLSDSVKSVRSFAVDFIRENMKEVSSTASWRYLATSRPDIVRNLFRKRVCFYTETDL